MACLALLSPSHRSAFACTTPPHKHSIQLAAFAVADQRSKYMPILLYWIWVGLNCVIESVKLLSVPSMLMPMNCARNAYYAVRVESNHTDANSPFAWSIEHDMIICGYASDLASYARMTANRANAHLYRQDSSLIQIFCTSDGWGFGTHFVSVFMTSMQQDNKQVL